MRLIPAAILAVMISSAATAQTDISVTLTNTSIQAWTGGPRYTNQKSPGAKDIQLTCMMRVDTSAERAFPVDVKAFILVENQNGQRRWIESNGLHITGLKWSVPLNYSRRLEDERKANPGHNGHAEAAAPPEAQQIKSLTRQAVLLYDAAHEPRRNHRGGIWAAVCHPALDTVPRAPDRVLGVSGVYHETPGVHPDLDRVYLHFQREWRPARAPVGSAGRGNLLIPRDNP